MEEKHDKLGDLLAERSELKERIEGHNKASQELKVLTEELDERIMAIMDDQHIESTSNKTHNVVIRANEFPNVTDWEAFGKYVNEHQALYLLQRRPSGKALLELIQLEGEVPGVETFTKRTVAVKKRPTASK